MAAKSRVGEMLVKAGVVDELQLRSALARQEQWGGRLGKTLSDMGLADDETIAEALSQGAGVPRVRLGQLTKDAMALGRLDPNFAEQRGVFPVQLKDHGRTLVLAMADPTDLELMDQVAMLARSRVAPVVASEEEIQHAILRHYRNRAPPPPQPGKKPRVMDMPDAMELVDTSGEPLHAPPVEPAGRNLEVELSREGDRSAEFYDVSQGPSDEEAGRILEELFTSGGAAEAALSAEELARLETLRAHQAKSSKVLQAVLELLAEKGVLSSRDLQGRTKSQ